MATKIDTIKLGNSEYEIDLKSTATPSIASLSTSGAVTVGGNLTVKGTSNLSNVNCTGNITIDGQSVSINSGAIHITTSSDAITLSSGYVFSIYGTDGIFLSGEVVHLNPDLDILLNPGNADYIRFKKGKSGTELSIQPNYLLKMSASEYSYEVYFQILGPIEKFISKGLSFTKNITGAPVEILESAIGFGAPMHLVPICVYSSQDDAYYSGIFNFSESYSGAMSITFRFPGSTSDILNMDLTRTNINMKLIQLS